MAYLILAPSFSERTSGDKRVIRCDSLEQLERTIKGYSGDIDRLEIYKAEKLTVKITLEDGDAGTV